MKARFNPVGGSQSQARRFIERLRASAQMMELNGTGNESRFQRYTFGLP